MVHSVSQAHKAVVWGLAMSPSGDLVASASADRTVLLWKVTYPGEEEGHLHTVSDYLLDSAVQSTL